VQEDALAPANEDDGSGQLAAADSVSNGCAHRGGVRIRRLSRRSNTMRWGIAVRL
jgi:hypothetical protein